MPSAFSTALRTSETVASASLDARKSMIASRIKPGECLCRSMVQIIILAMNNDRRRDVSIQSLSGSWVRSSCSRLPRILRLFEHYPNLYANNSSLTLGPEPRGAVSGAIVPLGQGSKIDQASLAGQSPRPLPKTHKRNTEGTQFVERTCRYPRTLRTLRGCGQPQGRERLGSHLGTGCHMGSWPGASAGSRSDSRNLGRCHGGISTCDHVGALGCGRRG